MNKAETAAKRIVERVVAGARMHFRETQSSGEPDFDLEYASGMKVPLEVTVSTDEEGEATSAAILRSRRGGPFVPRVCCATDWYVHPVPGANINKIRLHVDRLLAAIEAEGRQEFNASTDAEDSAAVLTILRELGIEAGSVTRWKSPGIGIALPGDGGLVDPNLVNEAVAVEASKADNRRKLDTASGAEKHLFIYITPARHIVWVAARDEFPPTCGPVLPPEVTDVWVATWTGDGSWHTVWRARAGEAWVHLGRVDIDPGQVPAV